MRPRPPADLRAARAAARAASDRRDWADALPRWQALEAAAPRRRRPADRVGPHPRLRRPERRSRAALPQGDRTRAGPPRRRAAVARLADALVRRTRWARKRCSRRSPRSPAAFAGGGDGFDAWRGVAEARRNCGQPRGFARSARARPATAPGRPGHGARHRADARLARPLRRSDRRVHATHRTRSDRPGQHLRTDSNAEQRRSPSGSRGALPEARSPPIRRPAAPRRRTRCSTTPARCDGPATTTSRIRRSQGLPYPDAQWLRDYRTGRELRNWADAGVRVLHRQRRSRHAPGHRRVRVARHAVEQPGRRRATRRSQRAHARGATASGSALDVARALRRRRRRHRLARATSAPCGPRCRSRRTSTTTGSPATTGSP